MSNTAIGFCDEIIEIGSYLYLREKESIGLILAQLEVLGIPYLDALIKQGVSLPIDQEILRKILNRQENKKFYCQVKTVSKTIEDLLAGEGKSTQK